MIGNKYEVLILRTNAINKKTIISLTKSLGPVGTVIEKLVYIKPKQIQTIILKICILIFFQKKLLFSAFILKNFAQK